MDAGPREGESEGPRQGRKGPKQGRRRPRAGEAVETQGGEEGTQAGEEGTQAGEEAGPRGGGGGDSKRGGGDPGREEGEGDVIPDSWKTSQPPAPGVGCPRARGWYTVRSSLGKWKGVPGHSGMALS